MDARDLLASDRMEVVCPLHHTNLPQSTARYIRKVEIMIMEEFTVDCCPRCGRHHKRVRLRQFSRGALLGLYAHWAECQVSGEPIIVVGRRDPQCSDIQNGIGPCEFFLVTK